MSPHQYLQKCHSIFLLLFTKMPPHFFCYYLQKCHCIRKQQESYCPTTRKLLSNDKKATVQLQESYCLNTIKRQSKKTTVQKQESYCPTTRKLLSKHIKTTVKENYCSKTIKLLSNDKKATVQR